MLSETHYDSHVGLKLMAILFLAQFFKYWDYRHESSYLTFNNHILVKQY